MIYFWTATALIESVHLVVLLKILQTVVFSSLSVFSLVVRPQMIVVHYGNMTDIPHQLYTSLSSLRIRELIPLVWLLLLWLELSPTLLALPFSYSMHPIHILIYTCTYTSAYTCILWDALINGFFLSIMNVGIPEN